MVRPRSSMHYVVQIIQISQVVQSKACRACALLLAILSTTSSVGHAADRIANDQQAMLLWEQVSQIGKDAQRTDDSTSSPKQFHKADHKAYLEIAKRLPRLADILKLRIQSSGEEQSSAAEDLSISMLELLKMQRNKQAQVIAMAIFYGLDTSVESVAIARRRAFNVLFEAAGQREPTGANVVTMHVKGITCHGRFLDSMREYVRDENPWILRIDVELQHPIGIRLSAPNQTWVLGGAQQLPDSFSGITEIRVYIDQPKSAADVARAFAESERYSMKNWTVLLPQRIDTLLDKPNDASAD